jgi:hypothetical protein
MAGYFKSLVDLSAKELHRETEQRARSEKKKTVQLIASLSEVSRRQVHLAMGCSSLFDYCLRYLGLSEGQAHCRIQVARVCQRFPRILDALLAQHINLSIAAQLAPLLTEENCDQWVQDCSGLTVREVKVKLAELQPRPELTSGVRRAAPSRTENPRPSNSSDSLFTQAEPKAPTQAPKVRGRVEPATADVFNFRFSGSSELKEKLDRLAEVLGVHNAQGQLAKLVEIGVDAALDRKDPQRKLPRREARQRKQNETNDSPRPAPAPPQLPDPPQRQSPPPPAKPTPRRSRYIPSKVREKVLAGAKHQCEFVGQGGARCTARTGLEIDHIQPFARAGSHAVINLRCLCRAHNQWAARRFFGEAFIQQSITKKDPLQGTSHHP